MTVILLITKLLSLFTTGLLGLGGVVYDYKDEKGKLTPKGRWAFIGIVVSSLLSILILGFEEYKAIDSATEAANRLTENARKQEELSTQIQTSLNYTKGLSDRMTESANSLQSLLDQTATITSGLQTSASTSENILTKQIKAVAAQKRLTENQQTMFAHLTGENSFCYLSPGIESDELSFDILREGKYPVYDVHIYIAEKGKPNEQPKTYAPGTIGAFPRYVGSIKLPKTDQLNLFIMFETRYNTFLQLVKLARIGGEWKFAYRVLNGTKRLKEILERINEEDRTLGMFLPDPKTEPQILREFIHSDFPTINGKVNFNLSEFVR